MYFSEKKKKYWNLTRNEELWSVVVQLLENKARKNIFRPPSLKILLFELQFNKIFKRLIGTTWPILLISGQDIFFFLQCLQVFYLFLVFKSSRKFLLGKEI